MSMRADRREALGLSAKLFEDADYDFDALFARIRTDNGNSRKIAQPDDTAAG